MRQETISRRLHEAAQVGKRSGAIAELLSSQNLPSPRFAEAYGEFDFNDLSTASTDTTLSYGEYVPSAQRINFEPLVQRAESLAKFHGRLLSQEGSVEILRREWFCVAESNLVVVMIYFRV